MILTVDIGNSRIKWASWAADRIVARGVADYTDEQTIGLFDKLFSALNESPSVIYALCVAGDARQKAFSSWVKQRWQLDIAFLNTAKQYKNIINAYAEPSQHGVDRWAAIVAGFQGNPGCSICVISAGTAITFDLVMQSGQHLGGYILPSYASMQKSLLSDTANLESKLFESSRITTPVVQQSVPANTNDAINQGLHKLLQAGIREICQYASSRLGGQVKILITGGFAETILRYPDMPVMHYHPDLVMQGLYSIMAQR